MDKEQIQAMPAGGELDDLIKRHVMGWELKQNGTGYVDGEYYWYDGDEFVNDENFNPSTDISAAWEVIEETESDFSWEIKKEGYYFNEEGLWEIRCAGFGELIKSKSVPEAICKAALLAVMEL